MYDQHFVRDIDDTLRTAERNLRDFEERRGIALADIYEDVLKGEPSLVDMLVVSTSVRGQGGSTSDIDLIGVVSRSAQTAPLPTELNVVNGCRFSVTYVHEPALEQDIGLLATYPTEPDRVAIGIEEALPLFHMSWRDLERLVNGYSYRTGVPYHEHLSLLTQWWSARALCRMDYAHGLYELSIVAGLPLVARGYLDLALLSMMEWLMAVGGDVQGNNKWTFQRWADFEAPAPIGEVKREIDRIYDRGGWDDYGVASMSALWELRKSSAPRPYREDDTRLRLKSSLQSVPFLSTAVSITGPDAPAWLVPTTLWKAVEDVTIDGLVLSREDARVALDLIHDEVLTCRVGRL